MLALGLTIELRQTRRDRVRPVVRHRVCRFNPLSRKIGTHVDKFLNAIASALNAPVQWTVEKIGAMRRWARTRKFDSPDGSYARLLEQVRLSRCTC
jgi:hypothetical protein